MFEITSRGTIEVLGHELRRLPSIFRNPNAAGFLYSIGLLAAGVRYVDRREKLFLAIALLNGVGFFLSKSRAAYFSVVIAVCAFFILRRLGAEGTRVTIWLGTFATALGVAMVAGVLPEPQLMNSIDFTGRSKLWGGSIKAILQRPVLGYGSRPTGLIMEPYVTGPISGAGTHNGYLRQFIHTGLIGGVAYSLFVVLALVDGARRQSTVGEAMVFAVAVAISVNEVFNGNTIFGISMGSVIAAVTYGYAIRHDES